MYSVSCRIKTRRNAAPVRRGAHHIVISEVRQKVGKKCEKNFLRVRIQLRAFADCEAREKQACDVQTASE